MTCKIEKIPEFVVKCEKFDLGDGYTLITTDVHKYSMDFDRYDFTVYEKNGKEVAWFNLRINHKKPKKIDFGTIEVKYNYRRRGIGRKILRFVIKTAEERTGFDEIVVLCGNPTSLKAFISYGFDVKEYYYDEGANEPYGGKVSYKIRRQAFHASSTLNVRNNLKGRTI